MRLILMFDLPMTEKEDVKIYTDFRKNLLNQGYVMLQYSIYVKCYPNKTSAMQGMQRIKSIVPNKGAVRAIIITEAQYQSMAILVGGKSFQEDNVTSCPLTVL